MTVYIYKEWISADEELMSEQVFNELAKQCDNIAWAENHLDWEWEEVDEEECTQDEIDNYIKNGYVWLGER